MRRDIQKDHQKSRLFQILSAFITIMIILSIRIFKLQVYPSERVQSSYQNHQEEKITNINYTILDTNKKELLKYKKKYVLVIDTRPFSLNNYEETIQDLMTLNFLMKEENPKFSYSNIMKQSGKLYFDVSEETYEKINKLKDIKGIYTYIANEVDVKEAWSTSNMLAKINDDDFEKNSLEYILHEYLKSNETPKKEFYLDERSVYSKSITNISDENRNIQLTIDKDMDDKVREVLESEEYSYLDNIGVTILESDTGKIRVISQKNESLANINLGIQQIGYEPGSIYKIITEAVALDMGLININDRYLCNARVCKKSHGNLTVEEAFEKSCNDVFAQIGTKVGYNKLMDYSKSLGIFNRVLDFQGENKNEAIGIMPKEDAGLSNISIGQCMNVTPIQMLGAVNSIINDGIYIKPYLVDGILDKDGNVVKSFNSEKNKVFSDITAKIVKQSMRNVVLKGTGVKANIKNLDIGGKTGSSTGRDGTTHGWFAGYFNINNKKYTMVVFTPDIENLKGTDNEEYGGGDTAAPIFKDIVNILNK